MNPGWSPENTDSPINVMFLYLERPRTGHHPPPPLPKKTVPPFQEYRFGFEEEMPPDLLKEGGAEVKEGGEGVDGGQEGQKKKKNATRRMEQILKIHTEPDRKQDLVIIFNIINQIIYYTR